MPLSAPVIAANEIFSTQFMQTGTENYTRLKRFLAEFLNAH